MAGLTQKFLMTNRAAQPGGFTSDRSGITCWTTEGDVTQFDNWDKAPSVQDFVLSLQAQEKSVVLLIHGFDNSWEKDMGLFEKVNASLGNSFTVLAYSWDSLGSVAAYAQDRERAVNSAEDLKTVFRILAGSVAVSVVAHSMGNYVLQLCLTSIFNAIPTNEPFVHLLNRAVLVAADIDFDVMDVQDGWGFRYLALAGTVLHCNTDGALLVSTVLHGVERLGLCGPRDHVLKQFEAVDCGAFLKNELPIQQHGAYFTNSKCLEIIRKALL
jgi:esterase/lipase superfamily enzyme